MPLLAAIDALNRHAGESKQFAIVEIWYPGIFVVVIGGHILGWHEWN